jgi:hypothetical protein
MLHKRWGRALCVLQFPSALGSLQLGRCQLYFGSHAFDHPGCHRHDLQVSQDTHPGEPRAPAAARNPATECEEATLQQHKPLCASIEGFSQQGACDVLTGPRAPCCFGRSDRVGCTGCWPCHLHCHERPTHNYGLLSSPCLSSKRAEPALPTASCDTSPDSATHRFTITWWILPSRTAGQANCPNSRTRFACGALALSDCRGWLCHGASDILTMVRMEER